jgi:hypothetical protein
MGLGCAEASAPLPPPLEIVLVLNQGDASLSLVPVESPSAVDTIPLGALTMPPAGLAAVGGWALVPLGASDAVAVVDLQARAVVRTVGLAAGSGATGAAIVDDSIAYVGNPALNTVTRVNYLTGDTASVAVGVTPQAMVFSRGRIFVLNGNLAGGVPAGPSWISVVDPVTNRLATGIDSIALPGPGGAASGVMASDGVLYVLNRGPADGSVNGRLSLVDPVARVEAGSFGGFGGAPGRLAADEADRLYVSSPTEGMMVFDRLGRQVIRGAGDGVSIPTLSAVAVDAAGRIYGVEAGACGSPAVGRVHILRRNLTTSRVLDVGSCPVDAVVTNVPPVP